MWWLTGSYSLVGTWLERDARASAVVDTCDLSAGEIFAVTVSGRADVVPMDRRRAIRKLTKYLGPLPETWPTRFTEVLADPTTKLVRLVPARVPQLRDLSFVPASERGTGSVDPPHVVDGRRPV